MQLSGVGNADELKALGLDTVENLPGVGENLQDHIEVYVQHRATQPVSVAPGLLLRNRPKIALEWLFLRKGLGATNHFEGGGFARSNGVVDYPNLMFHFLPIAVRYDGSQPAGDHGYQVHIGPMYSDSRGTVKIRSKDPQQKPALRFNYLSTANDRREWVEAIRLAATNPLAAGLRSIRRWRNLSGTRGPLRRGDPLVGGARRRDCAPPVVHLPDGRR